MYAVTAAVLLAIAWWIGAGPLVVRTRAGMPSRAERRPTGFLRGPVPARDPLGIAASLDVLAVCLAAGMAVPIAAAATASSAPPRLAQVLCRAADLLTLGADPGVAWAAVPATSAPSVGSFDAHVDALLRLARRSAASGAALAEGIAALAAQSRYEITHAVAAAAERAGF